MGNEHKEAAAKVMRELQKEMYPVLSDKILEYASHEYLALCKILRREPILDLTPGSIFNHEYPIVRRIYEFIADSFYYFYSTQSIARLESEPKEVEEEIRKAWQNYFFLEAHRLTNIPSFTDRLMHVIAQVEPAEDRETEEALIHFLQKEYPPLE